MDAPPAPTPFAASAPAYTAGPKQIWGWAAGRVAEFGLIGTYGQAISIFPIGFGLNPVTVSWCMMLPRLVDGILDPFIGHWSDNAHTRWGRRKPFLVGGALLGAIFLVALWCASPAWSPLAQFVHLGVIGTCLYLAYGAYAMAWNAVGYELSDDYHERSKVAAIGGAFLAIMVLGNGWIYWFALRPVFGGVVWGMRWVSTIMAALVVVSAVLTASTMRERFTHTNRQHVPILPALRTSLANWPFACILLMKIFEIFGSRLIGGVSGGVSFYLGVYYVCQGDQDFATRLAGVGATLGAVWNFGVLPLIKPASRWIGKRGVLIFCTAIGLAAALVSPFATTPLHPYWGVIPGLIVAPMLVISGTIVSAILPDICDLDELRTGERREGLFTAVMGFVGKLEISLSVVLIGYVVSLAAVDTKIGSRWETLATDAEKAAVKFPAGEAAVFRLKDGKAATFDTFTVIPCPRPAPAPEFELWVGDESPTGAFRSLGRFQTEEVGTLPQDFNFPPVTARYFKAALLPPPHGPASTIELRGVRLTNSQTPHTNLLAGTQGGKMVAAKPPDSVLGKLYWLVMVPNIGFAGLTLLAAILFPLTEAQMLEVRRQLDASRMAKATAGEPTDSVTEEFVREHSQPDSDTAH